MLASPAARRSVSLLASLAPAWALVATYYAGRVTLRYDWIGADRLDTVVADLTALGRRSFLVVDDWEEAEFRARFAPHSRAGRLDWDPLARVSGSPEVRIYDLAGSGAPIHP